MEEFKSELVRFTVKFVDSTSITTIEDFPDANLVAGFGKDLELYSYNVVLIQELKPHNHNLRRDFTNWS